MNCDFEILRVDCILNFSSEVQEELFLSPLCHTSTLVPALECFGFSISKGNLTLKVQKKNKCTSQWAYLTGLFLLQESWCEALFFNRKSASHYEL